MIILVLIEATKNDPYTISQVFTDIEVYAFRGTMVSFTIVWCLRNIITELLDCSRKTRIAKREMEHDLRKQQADLERDEREREAR